MCPRISDPFYIVTYYIKWVTTSWTHSMYSFSCRVHVIDAEPFMRNHIIEYRGSGKHKIHHLFGTKRNKMCYVRVLSLIYNVFNLIFIESDITMFKISSSQINHFSTQKEGNDN